MLSILYYTCYHAEDPVNVAVLSAAYTLPCSYETGLQFCDNAARGLQ